MGVPIFGINIPAPKVKIDKTLLEKYADLYRGIRDKKDTVTWRTLIITIRELLKNEAPDHKKTPKRYHKKGRILIKQLVNKTFLERLVPEIEYAVGVRGATGRGGEDLDYLLFSGRHFPEPLLWSLAEYIKSTGKTVAVINPVGHYGDGQTRVIGPFKYFRNIKKLVILASTQSKVGGSISVLTNVVKLLRNNNLVKRIKNVEIIIPMFGGSRGHRFGQSQEVGYEVMEAGFNAQILSLITDNILTRLKNEKVVLPNLRFSSIDIHNEEYPKKTFNEVGLNFFSIDSSSTMAHGIIKFLDGKKAKIPLKLVACDTGAIPRTQKLAHNILFAKENTHEKIQVIYMEKKRLSAGVVKDTTISKIEEWKKIKDLVKIRKVNIPLKPVFKNTIIVYSDDMIDTGGTAEKDLKFISSLYPNCIVKIFVATHPVLSKGFSAIKRIGADVYLLGNTLNWEGLSDVKGVEIVDFSGEIFNFISLPQEIL